ncbi:MAG TPA: isocitrate/isopropylmalate family dehydrogenase [Verrucomicrobiae bacterium]|nr:isocitrate/isopropylmalate family dehydrogenase [Verrucomicrobiae bacterium]
MQHALNQEQPSLLAFLGLPSRSLHPNKRPLIGVIEGSGIGAEVIGGALRVLAATEQVCGFKCELRHGGAIGEEAEKHFGTPLPENTAQFFTEIFSRGGALLNGPGGGRYVYDLRKRFDLFCKFAPIRAFPQLARNAPNIVSDNSHPIDMLIVRDNIAGAYQGEWTLRETKSGRIAEHSFSYTDTQVQRLAEVAARAAAARRGKIHVIVKDGGLPAASALWRQISVAEARKHNVEALFMNIDLAAYEFIRNPAQFDVVLTPNLFGDILVDITGALLGSRGVTFSGNYDGSGNGVYQTNHGCAHDLAGADVANPGGQILSLAMMLRESFGQRQAAALIENALAATWQDGWRTADVAEPGCRVVGTHAMSEQVAQRVLRLAEKPNEIRVAAD